MRTFIIIFFVSMFSISYSQSICPGTYAYQTLFSGTSPDHVSDFNSFWGCWHYLTEFMTDNAVYPSGLDVAVIITGLTGNPNSIIDHNNPAHTVQVGDTFYLRQSGVDDTVQLRHINSAGLSFTYVIKGFPTQYSQAYSMTYYQGTIWYPVDCNHYGYPIKGSGTLYTCIDDTRISEFKSDNNLYIYPNPVRDNLNITSAINEYFSYEISGLPGNIIIKGNGTGSAEINTSYIKSGIYLIKIKNPEGRIVYSSKLLKL